MNMQHYICAVLKPLVFYIKLNKSYKSKLYSKASPFTTYCQIQIQIIYEEINIIQIIMTKDAKSLDN